MVENTPQGRITERTLKQFVDVPMPQIMEEITVPVPHVQERIVEVIHLIPRKCIPERIAERTVDAPRPPPQQQIAEIVKTIPQERISERTVEQNVDVPVQQSCRKSLR